MAKLLIVDNQRAIRRNFTEILEREKYVVMACESAEECKRLLTKNSYDLVIYNAYMPNLDGLLFMNYIQNKGIDTSVIMSADHFAVEDIVKVIKSGCHDYISIPCDIPKLIVTVRNALTNVPVKKANPKLCKKTTESIPEIIGNSPKITHVKNLIKRVAATDTRVLITGANGTGKELVARWLHEFSHRRLEPFVGVNCAAIHNDLIDSELFGHEKGSFTSADSRHEGRFEQANGGTLFLDEIGDMSLSAQAKVLRALQENKVCHVGGKKDIDVNVRVIAATNKNLKEEIVNGNFREDLFHRLNVIRIHVPSLAERREDIPMLVDKFNERYSRKKGINPKNILPEAMKELQSRPWTGNIRELQNVVERLVILCDDTVTQSDINLHYTCE